MPPVDAKTQITGILGSPVDHSLSPRMHNAAFAALDLNWSYLAFPVPPGHVAEVVRGLALVGCRGLNATIPHKQEVIDACSSMSDTVRAIGAANTLVPDGDGGFAAHNTDAEGFIRAIDEAAPIDLSGETVLLLGAGGAARAVVHAVRARGAQVIIANRTPARAEELGEAIAFEPAAVRRAVDDCRLIVNSTSLGMGRSDLPDELPLDGIGTDHVVNDLVYRPGGTPWLHAAAERGARPVDGLGMLLHQGAVAFEMWTDRPAPLEVMRDALLSA